MPRDMETDRKMPITLQQYCECAVAEASKELEAYGHTSQTDPKICRFRDTLVDSVGKKIEDVFRIDTILYFATRQKYRRHLSALVSSAIMNFNNLHNLPKDVETNATVDVEFECKQIHHDDPLFPLVRPDMFFKGRDGIEDKKIQKNSSEDFFEEVSDEEGRRRYLHLMRKNRETPSNLWKKGRRHYVRGAIYKRVHGKFFILPMQDPKQYDKAWNVWKYRLKVNIQDEHGNVRATTYVECSHSPLYQLDSLVVALRTKH